MTVNAVSRSLTIRPSYDGKLYSTYPSGDKPDPGATPAFFTENYSTGDFSHTEGGVSWLTGTAVNVTVNSGRGNPGYAAQYEYSTSAGTNAEIRFDLGALYTELTIKFDLYIPNGGEAWGGAAYSHSQGTNRKLFRLWPATYDDYEKVGASLWEDPNSDNWSELLLDWNTGSGIGPKPPHGYAFITSADLGTWVAVKIYVKAATVSTNGSLRVYKNGTLWCDASNAVNNYRSGEAHAFRYGYLLGSANGGYPATTRLQIDNVEIYDGVQ
jgi:hypothetical protein